MIVLEWSTIAMVRLENITLRGVWLAIGILLLGVCGCGAGCPRDSIYREPAAWLATHALPAEAVAYPSSATACLGAVPAVSFRPQADASTLLSLLDQRRPDYLLIRDSSPEESLRGQPWFNERYDQVATWRRIYPTVAGLTLFSYTPSPYDLGATLPAPGTFVDAAVVLRGYQLSSSILTPDIPSYLTLLWDDTVGLPYAGLIAIVRLVAQDTDQEWYVAKQPFEPAGATVDGDSRLAQRYLLVPPDDLPQGIYELQVSLQDMGGRPVTVRESDGKVSEYLLLTTITHPPDVAQSPIEIAYDVDYRLGDVEGIRLAGYDAVLRAQPGDDVRVTLLWTTLTAIPEDYRVFVHIVSEDESLLTQSDGIPVYGFYPTFEWSPGDYVRDEYALALPGDTPRGDYVLTVGLYHAASGERLPVFDASGVQQPQDRVVLVQLAVR